MDIMMVIRIITGGPPLTPLEGRFQRKKEKERKRKKKGNMN